LGRFRELKGPERELEELQGVEMELLTRSKALVRWPSGSKTFSLGEVDSFAALEMELRDLDGGRDSELPPGHSQWYS
jgi:hypothetical protein